MTALAKKRTRKKRIGKKKYFAPTYVRYQKSENIGQPVLPSWFLDLAHMALPTLTALGNLRLSEDVMLQSVNLGLLLGKERHCMVKGCRTSSEVN